MWSLTSHGKLWMVSGSLCLVLHDVVYLSTMLIFTMNVLQQEAEDFWRIGATGRAELTCTSDMVPPEAGVLDMKGLVSSSHCSAAVSTLYYSQSQNRSLARHIIPRRQVNAYSSQSQETAQLSRGAIGLLPDSSMLCGFLACRLRATA